MSYLATNPIIKSFFHSDLLGKGIFISLFLLSLTTWTVFLKKIHLYREFKQKGKKLQEKFKKNCIHPLNLKFADQHPFIEIYNTLKMHTLQLLSKNGQQSQSATYLSPSDIEYLQERVTNAVYLQVQRLQKNLFILPTIVSLAPFLGLLGTVWGILLTFSQLEAGMAAQTNSIIMGGLSMALGTTIVGLFVAIPALIFYNYLKSYGTQFAADMENFSCSSLAAVELQYRKVDV